MSDDNQEPGTAAQPLDPATRATAMQASRYMTWLGVGELLLSVVTMLLLRRGHDHLWYVYGIFLVVGGCAIIGYSLFMRRRVVRMT